MRVCEISGLTEIAEVIGELTDKIWYDRHQVRKAKIESGKIKVVEKETYPRRGYQERTIQRDIWEGAQKSAKKMEKQSEVTLKIRIP